MTRPIYKASPPTLVDGEQPQLLVDSSGKLQVAGTLTTEGGATEAKQDDIITAIGATNTAVAAVEAAVEAGTVDSGTAGTPSAEVLSVQGVASMTPVITADGLRTDAIMSAQTALTPKFVAIAASSSGNNTLLSAVASKKIRVLAYNIMGAGAVNAKFQSGAGGTDLTGLKYIAAAGGGICAPFNPVGWFETASNTLLNLNLSGAVAVGGELVYVEV